MRINFIGNYKEDILGDVADEIHMARDLARAGNLVNCGDREVWRAYTLGYDVQEDWRSSLDFEADIVLVAKWHLFNDGKYIETLKKRFNCPVVYMVWDRCTSEHNWNWEMAKAADLYLTNEGGEIAKLRADGVNAYYFPFDAGNGEYGLGTTPNAPEVVFLGNYMDEGDRVEYLRYIKDYCKLTVFSPRFSAWQSEGIEAYPPIYGEEFNKVVRSAKINLAFSVDDHCWGYWSNRIGRTLAAGGFLMTRYTPGMELFLKDNVEYFSSKEEAVQKILFYLNHPHLIEQMKLKAAHHGQEDFTSIQRMKQLYILLDRYLKGGLDGRI